MVWLDEEPFSDHSGGMNIQPSPDSLDPGFQRTLDAALHRLTEGLRTLEDPCRFHLQNSPLAAGWQDLRRRASGIRVQLEKRWGPLGAIRDLSGDPLSAVEGTGPHAHLQGLLAANTSRVREASRALEEQLRLVDSDLAQQMQEIRYSIYSLDSICTGILTRGKSLEDRRLYLLVTESLCRGDIYETTEAAIAGGADIVQLREKDCPTGQLLEMARRLRAITEKTDTLLMINDHIAVAQLSGADGVHLGQEDVPPHEARKILGPDAIIGLSTHCKEQAEKAAGLGADYIGVGPIHETQTKVHRSSVGTGYITEAQSCCPLPGFAIGRVDDTTIDAVLSAGADRIAICTGIIGKEDPEAATRLLAEKLEAAQSERNVGA